MQRALRAALVGATAAQLDAVGRQLGVLSADADGDLAPAAARAERAWGAFRAAEAAQPRDDFAAGQAYTAALRALDPFTAACGTAP